MKSPRSLFTNLSHGVGSTVEHLREKVSGFKHEEGLAVRIDQFAQMYEAQKVFTADLRAYADATRKHIAAEALMAEALSACSLHDFPSDGPSFKLLSARAVEQKKLHEAAEAWMSGFATISDFARDHLKELDTLRVRIDAINKQVSALEFLKKKKDTPCTEEQEAYTAAAAQLSDDIVAAVTHKDQLVAKWIGKWAVLDARLEEARRRVVESRAPIPELSKETPTATSVHIASAAAATGPSTPLQALHAMGHVKGKIAMPEQDASTPATPAPAAAAAAAVVVVTATPAAKQEAAIDDDEEEEEAEDE